MILLPNSLISLTLDSQDFLSTPMYCVTVGAMNMCHVNPLIREAEIEGRKIMPYILLPTAEALTL